MSMTKRYLESLPKEQQDDILGLPPDEWYESAENEPGDIWDEIAKIAADDFSRLDKEYGGGWEEIEPTESAENGPQEWPHEPGDEQCADKFEHRSNAPLIKPRGKCVIEVAHDGVEWNV